ncbi:MAG TPA: hypothetical protein VFT91_07850 [Dehalococcoidia bacterium]|nr:hypothetical protein [Dehalococcoidia bacterium]
MAEAIGLRDYAAVGTWLAGLRAQWGAEPEDMVERLGVLERFCRFVVKSPDEIIAECVREVEGGKRIRIKGRRFYSEKIAEFQAAVDGDAREQGRWGNTVRSFLIHNGIFIQAGLQG